jgi:hypothetical protein
MATEYACLLTINSLDLLSLQTGKNILRNCILFVTYIEQIHVGNQMRTLLRR